MGEVAAKAVVQLLFATGKSFTVDGLREKLRECFLHEIRPERRAVAALNNVELIAATSRIHHTGFASPQTSVGGSNFLGNSP